MRKVIKLGEHGITEPVHRSQKVTTTPNYNTFSAEDRKTAQGRYAWSKLHLYTGHDPQWVELWQMLIPSGCECKSEFKAIYKQHPFCYNSSEAFFESTITLHNAVNAKLNKPTVSLDRAYLLWRHRRPDTARTRAIITVANGTQFVELLKLTRPLMQSYADRCNADLIDLDNDTESWGPMEKFRTWHFAKEYDEVLFVDADCIIKPCSPNIFESYSEDVCIHDDWSRLYKTDWLERERKAVATKTGLAIEHTAQCLNSGVILSRKPVCDIWQRPTIDIGTTHCAEQIWLEHQIDNAVSSGATLGRMDAKWNWQWWFSTHDEGAFQAGLNDAYIVHFANAPNRLKLIGDYINTL